MSPERDRPREVELGEGKKSKQQATGSLPGKDLRAGLQDLAEKQSLRKQVRSVLRSQGKEKGTGQGMDSARFWGRRQVTHSALSLPGC